MKQPILIISFLFIANLSAFSQSKDEVDWMVIENAREEFKAWIPETNYVDSSRTIKDIYYGKYKSRVSNTFFIIISRPKDTGSNIGTVFTFGKETGLKQTIVSLGNFKARQLKFFENVGFYHKVAFAITDKRIYIFHTVSETPSSPEIDLFFYKVNLKPEALNMTEVELEKLGFTFKDGSLKTEENRAPKWETQRVFKNGSKGRVPSGTGELPTLPGSENRAIALLSKPRARYTNIARIYNIQGSVKLRIVFHKSGKISTVEPITKLPFGLTRSAINSAFAIKFRPAIKNGKPVSVTKRIQYSFTIY